MPDAQDPASNGRVDPELLREQLLDILATADEPMTTAQLRHRLDGATVNELVYRNLIVLESRGRLRRLRPGGRHVAWESVAAATKGTTP
ncbi:hypothetical protein MycrhDRAFT_5578 [Mycolicibacterium rhodesiae JS60]|nr:hypothetical protein MycrhDRAFT_5578 [Mycolicibacterium rhodesiae JS60]